MAVETSELPQASLRLQQYLSSLPQSIEELVSFLHSESESALSDPENEDAKNSAFQVLSEIHRFLLSPSLDQEVIDALAFELPKAVCKYGEVSDRCLEIVESVIDRFIATCSPRDMLSILCEALDSPTETGYACSYIAPLLSGLSKVFISIHRRQFEQVKVAVPIILKVLKEACFEVANGDTEDTKLVILFSRALGIAESICNVSTKLEGNLNKKLRLLLGSYVLQNLALVSLSMGHNITNCLALVSKLSTLLPFCSLSYLGLITGSDVDVIINIVVEEWAEEEYYMSCLSYIKHGASLSVIWGHISDSIAQAAGENMPVVKEELRINQIKRWQTIAMLNHIFSSVNLSWELKKHTIDFLLCITDGGDAQSPNDGNIDCSAFMSSLYSTVEAISKVIIYAPNTLVRQNAFQALKRVLSDTPTAQRFDIVRALISNSDSSSMRGILLDLVRGELRKESLQRLSQENHEVMQTENQVHSITSFWTAGVLEIVELVLRPPKGGPPSFPEDGEAVLATLNLYRFILMTESAGKTNYTGVLSKSTLQKAYNEWLCPLRTLVTGTMAENKNDCDPFAVETVCTLNPIELVLYRCIELVEEKLKDST